MNIDYCLLNPNQNITILVETYVERKFQPFVAKKLMEAEPSCEQVGFVEKDMLQMAGGEFCGNATICYAALLNENIEINAQKSLSLRVSGADTNVDVSLAKTAQNEFSAVVTMPKAISYKKIMLSVENESKEFYSVEFNGITHIISLESFSKKLAEKLCVEWCNTLMCDALGIMFLSEDLSNVIPLVYVKKSNTLFWESSCASGTAAVGVYLKETYNNSFKYLKFPAGVLGVEVKDGKILLHGKTIIIKHSNISISF